MNANGLRFWGLTDASDWLPPIRLYRWSTRMQDVSG